MHLVLASKNHIRIYKRLIVSRCYY